MCYVSIADLAKQIGVPVDRAVAQAKVDVLRRERVVTGETGLVGEQAKNLARQLGGESSAVVAATPLPRAQHAESPHVQAVKDADYYERLGDQAIAAGKARVLSGTIMGSHHV